MPKEYPNKEGHPGKGVVLSTYWNDEELSKLKEFMQKRGIEKESQAIKQGFFLGANVIDKLLGDLFEIKMKRKIRSDRGQKKNI